MKAGSFFTRGMLVRMAADALMLQFALMAALTLILFAKLLIAGNDPSIDLTRMFREYVSFWSQSGWPLAIISLVIFYFSGFYTYGRYYQGRYKALVVFQAVTQSYLVFGFVTYFFRDQCTLPRSAMVLAWLFTLGLLIGSRLWVRVWETWVHPERETTLKKANAQRRILVIGGGGYIGSALLPKLLDKGYHVRLFDLLLFDTDPIQSVLNHPRLEVVRGDFRHVDKVVEAMHGVDSVVHLGAIVGDPACELDRELTIEVNLSATKMVAEVSKLCGVERFVFASTCSVYGACDEMLDERSFVKPVSHYGNTKLAAERVLHGMASEGFRPTILRFATIYGLSGRTRFDLVVNLLTAKAKIEGKITVFGGDQWRPFVHVDDAAAGVARVLEAPVELIGNQTFNVGSDDQNYTIEQIGSMVHEHVLGAELLINKEGADKRNYRVSFAKIRNQLGFTPNWTVSEGIEQVLEAIARGEVSDYRDAKYSNVKFLTETGGSKLGRDDWAHKLLGEMAAAGNA